MSFTLQIGSTVFTMMPGGDFGQVLQQLNFGQSARGDVPRLATVRTDQPRTFTFPAMLEAATKDEAIAKLRDANLELSVSNTLIVQSANATNYVSFRTFPSGSVKLLPVVSWELENWAKVSITVTMEPFAYGAAITDGHESVATPVTVPLEHLIGEYAAPLTIDVHTHNGTDKLHSVYLALNENDTWTGWLMGVADAKLTWVSGWTDSNPDADAYGGRSKYTTNATMAYLDVNTAGVPPGDYLVMVRAQQTSGAPGVASTVSIAGQSRWTATIPADTVANPTDIWRYYEVGEISLPYSIVKGAAASIMRLNVQCNSATYHCYIDQVVLLPVKAGFIAWHPPLASDLAAGWKFASWFDADGPVYLDNVCDLTSVTGAPIKSLSGQIIVLADKSTGLESTVSLDVNFIQTPRYSLYR